MPGALQATGTQTGIPEGTQTIGPFTIIMSAVHESIPLTLANGDNLVAVPAGCQAVIIEPISVGAAAISVRTRGAAGADQQLSNVFPSVIALPTPLPATITINATGAGGTLQVIFV